MKAVFTGADAKSQVVTVQDPEKIPGHAIVEVAAAGICGTDRHIIEGDFPAQLPRILGHEISGRVLALAMGISGTRFMPLWVA